MTTTLRIGVGQLLKCVTEAYFLTMRGAQVITQRYPASIKYNYSRSKFHVILLVLFVGGKQAIVSV